MSTPRIFSLHAQRMLLGVRGVAAFWVFFGHLIYRESYNAGFGSTEGWGWLAYIVRFDYLAVDFFFVLSGCVLYLLHRKAFEASTPLSNGDGNWLKKRLKRATSHSKTIDGFYIKRLAKLYPMHLVGILLIGVYHYLQIPHPIFSGGEEKLLEYWNVTLVLNAGLMASWGIVPVASWNEPAWTVSAMAFVYLLFPNIVYFLKKLPDTAWVSLLSIAVVLGGYHFGRENIDGLSQSDGTGALMRSGSFFLVGMFSARLYTVSWAKEARWNIYFPLMLFSGAVLMIWFFEISQFSMTIFHLFYPFFMLSMLYCNDSGLTRIFTNRASQFLGAISYSLYILHYPTLLLVKYVAGDWFTAHSAQSALADIWLYVIVTALMIFIAWGGYVLIERPAQKVIRRLVI